MLGLLANVGVRRALLAGSGTAALALGGAYAGSDQGTIRSLNFWLRTLPVYAHYRLTQWYTKDSSEEEQDKAYNALHDMHSSRMESLVLDLKGFYLKLAQVVSTRDEVVPPQYMRWCRKMQSDVPTEYSASEIRSVVEKSFGKKLEEIFKEWDDKPIGAASIGQAHRAVLHDGTVVAVKVMYPNIEEKFRSDVKTATKFCALAQPAHLPFMREVEKQFMTEFDYRKEASNLDEIRRNILPTWGKQVDIPKPFPELCTKEVLVMQFLDGVPLLEGIRSNHRELAAKHGRTLEQLEEEHKEKLRQGLLKPSSLKAEKRKTALLSSYFYVYDAFLNTVRFLYNWPVGHYIASRPLQYEKSIRPLPLASILDLLLRVHAHQIFVDGCFNGDPHPGNILLLKDGRLGLIDYGQVKHISPETRLIYARLVKALAEDDKEKVVAIFHDEMKIETKNNDPEVLYRLAAFFHDRDSDDITGGLNVQLFMEEMDRRDPIVKQNDDFVMLGRLSILMRGMGNAFNVKLRTSVSWLSSAVALLNNPNRPQ